MEHYELEEDEVVRYKGVVRLKNRKEISELILTNHNFVIITKIKKMFSAEQVFVDTYPVDEIKFYQDTPQILRNGLVVELYFLHEEVEMMFENGGEIRKFINAALNLITNKNKFQRGAEKLKNTISMVDDSLGIKSVEVAKSVGAFALKNNVVGKVSTGAKLLNNVIKKK